MSKARLPFGSRIAGGKTVGGRGGYSATDIDVLSSDKGEVWIKKKNGSVWEECRPLRVV